MYPRATSRTPLTIGQERFAREYVRSGGKAADAIIKSFGGKSRNAARVAAHRQLKKPHVRRKIEELRQRMAKRSDITIDKVLTDYQLALDIAKSQQKAGDIVSAATAQAKLVGLLRDRVEHGGPGDFDSMENLSDIIEKVSQEVGEEAAQALLKVLRHADEPSPNADDDRTLADVEAPSNAIN